MTEKKTRNWKRIGWWTFWIVNVVGILIALPILMSIWPLLNVYWNTRSDEAVEANQTFQTNASLTLPEITLRPENGDVGASTSDELANIEEQLDQIEGLSQESVEAIIAEHFGKAVSETDTDPGTFDENSAVFEDINKVIREIEGQRYHIYLLELKDRNGNRTTRATAYTKPNAEFERSMQTMKLVQGNAQLKGIYDAFAHVLADMANDQDPPAIDEENEEVELEFAPNSAGIPILSPLNTDNSSDNSVTKSNSPGLGEHEQP